MLELFTYDFMQRSLLAAAMVGGLCSVIGVFVVLRGLAFVAAGTSHAAFAGVALGYLMVLLRYGSQAGSKKKAG
jgi:ABC-type Mn2+/Zn2+ transport system permease subunit